MPLCCRLPSSRENVRCQGLFYTTCPEESHRRKTQYRACPVLLTHSSQDTLKRIIESHKMSKEKNAFAI